MAIGAALCGAALFCFLQAGNFLVARDDFTHAEVAVVLSGEPIGRTLAARDLYKRGQVDRIVVIPEPSLPVNEEIVRLGLADPKLPPWPQRILRASGVPPSQCTLLPEPAEGTINEALAVQRFFRGKLPQSMVVVTSKFASRRARFIFRSVFQKEKARVYAFPTPYDTFEPKKWWIKPRNALQVVNEYLKLIANGLMLALAV